MCSLFYILMLHVGAYFKSAFLILFRRAIVRLILNVYVVMLKTQKESLPFLTGNVHLIKFQYFE